VPWALAYSEEQMIVEQERAELMNQRAQNEVCRVDGVGALDGWLTHAQFMTPGTAAPAQGAQAAL
jgi:hypothetical protein